MFYQFLFNFLKSLTIGVNIILDNHTLVFAIIGNSTQFCCCSFMPMNNVLDLSHHWPASSVIAIHDFQES